MSRKRSNLRLLYRWLTMTGLILADLLAFSCGYFLFRHGHQMPALALSSIGSGPNMNEATDIYLILGVAFIVCRYVFGDYNRRQLFWDGVRATTISLTLIALPDLFLVLLLENFALFFPFVFSWLFLIIALPLFRQTARRIMSFGGIWQIPTALIGTGRNACDAYSGLNGALSLGFDVRYLVIDETGTGVPAALSNLQHVWADDPQIIVGKLHDMECKQVIIAAEDAQGPQAGETIQRLIGADINVAIIPFLRGLPLFGMSTSYLFGKDVLLLQLRNNLARIPSRVTKRAVDFIGPILLLILFLPLLIAFSIAIKLDDGGPIFFVQRRVGRGNRPFDCYKFRTMFVNAESILADWHQNNPALHFEYLNSNFKLRDDPRVTRVGRWLRRTSLDELPQLVNVLIGQMSLVGPRPLIEREIAEYGPGFELYQRARPGMTGLWQISGRSETKFSDRVSYDEWYILNWSLWYDVVILVQTAWIVALGKGAF